MKKIANPLGVTFWACNFGYTFDVKFFITSSTNRPLNNELEIVILTNTSFIQSRL